MYCCSLPVEGEEGYFVTCLFKKVHFSQVCKATQRTGKRITEMINNAQVNVGESFPLEFHTEM